MTLEKYEEAQEIRDQINHTHDILFLLKNCRGQDLVARKCIDSGGMKLGSNIVINEVRIAEDEPIIQELIDTVQSEITYLENKFKEL